MTRKDYELIARTIREVTAYVGMDRFTCEIVAGRLAANIMADNPRFDPDKFTRACGF